MFSVLSKLIYPYLHWFNDINQSSINYCSFCFFFFSHHALDNKHFNVIFLKTYQLRLYWWRSWYYIIYMFIGGGVYPAEAWREFNPHVRPASCSRFGCCGTMVLGILLSYCGCCARTLAVSLAPSILSSLSIKF